MIKIIQILITVPFFAHINDITMVSYSSAPPRTIFKLEVLHIDASIADLISEQYRTIRLKPLKMKAIVDLDVNNN